MSIKHRFAVRSKHTCGPIRGTPGARARPNAVRLRFERLEERTLLSFSGPAPHWFSDVTEDIQAEFLSGQTGLEMLNNSEEGIKARLPLPGVVLDSISVGDRRFDSLAVPGWGWKGAVGQAALPVLRTSFIVPKGVEVTYDYAIHEAVSLGTDYLVYPVQPPDPETPSAEGTGYAQALAYDEDYYSGRTAGRTSTLTVSDPVVARDTAAVMAGICPFDYDPVSGEITVATELTFSLSFETSETTESGPGGFGATLDGGGAGETVFPPAAACAADYL